MVNRLSKIVKPAKKAASKQKPIPVKIVSDYDIASRPSPIDDMKWKARNALDTLQRAAEIKRDKPLMKAAKAEAKAQMKNLSGVCK